MEIIHLTEVDSTNLEAGRILETNKKSLPFVVIADRQTNGRGQGDHKWHSYDNMNITMSVVISPMIPSEKQFLLTSLTSVSLMETVRMIIKGDPFTHQVLSRNTHDNDVKIKWINDVYVDDNKIAGILISNKVLDNTIISSIIGIGLNVNQTEFPPSVPNPTSLKLTTKKEHIIEDTVTSLLINFERNFKKMLTEPEALIKTYSDNLYKLNEPYEYTINGKKEVRIIRGINEIGDMVF